MYCTVYFNVYSTGTGMALNCRFVSSRINFLATSLTVLSLSSLLLRYCLYV
jgi:hypothetical protein